MSWYGKGQGLGGPLGPKQKEPLPAQVVRYFLPPGVAAMESLPAPYLPPPEGESQGLDTTTTTRPCSPAASLMRAATATLSVSSLWALPLWATDRTGVPAGLALSSRLQRTGLPEGWGLGLGSD